MSVCIILYKKTQMGTEKKGELGWQYAIQRHLTYNNNETPHTREIHP